MIYLKMETGGWETPLFSTGMDVFVPFNMREPRLVEKAKAE